MWRSSTPPHPTCLTTDRSCGSGVVSSVQVWSASRSCILVIVSPQQLRRGGRWERGGKHAQIHRQDRKARKRTAISRQPHHQKESHTLSVLSCRNDSIP